MADFSTLKTAIQDAIKQNGNKEITGEILQTILLSIVNTLGDSAINDLVTALADEVAARQNADGTLQQNINTEAGTRATADTALGGRIDGEAETRGAADTALSGRITAITDYIAQGYHYCGIAATNGNPASGRVFYFAVAAGTYTNFGNITVGNEIAVLKSDGTTWSKDTLKTIDTTPALNSGALITSGAVKTAINGITSLIGNGYVYAGIATPSAEPVSGKVFYLALTEGTYTNFDEIEVSQGINILKYNPTDSEWTLDAFIGIDDTPTPNSQKLVKSGGAFDNVMTNGSAFDISAHFASGGTLATYADLSAALTALDTLSASYKRGGMSVKFVQSSDNKYVKFFCTADEFTTDVTQWQGVDKKPFLGSENIVKSGGIDNAILTISSHELKDYVPDYEFEKGAYNSSGEKTNLNYRVRTKNIVANDGILAIVPKTGWQVLVNIYANNVLSESIGYTSGKVDLSEAQQFTLSIKRDTEDTSETADVNEFVSGLTAQSKGISQVNFDALKKVVDKTIIYNLESILDFGNFERGSYNSSGQKVSVVNRIRLKEPVSLEQNIFIIPQAGWEVNVCTFNGNNVASYINYTSEKVLIEANTSFVLTIKKKAETSDAASVSVFVSGVKAQTECSSKNDVDKLKRVLSFPLEDFISDVNFENGSYNSSGTAVALSYRIRTKELSVINNDIQIVPKYGWRVGVSIYQNSSLNTNIDLSTEPIYIEKNKTFKLVIARVTENTSETADIATFMAGIAVLSTCTSKKDGDTLKNAVNKYLPYDSRFALCAMDFKRGRLNSSGEFETGYNYRITSEDILQYPEALTIRCSEGNFLTSIAYFDSEGVFVKMDSYSDEDKYIAPSQKFRLSIRRVTEVTSEQANNREFLAGIKTTTLSAPYSALSSFVNTNGKIINFLGDSYVANHNDTFEEGWCYKFAHRHNMVARNYGKNGYPITPESESGHVNITYIATTMADADYIVVVGGKNDYNAQVPLAAFKNAVANLIEYIIGRWPAVQLCFFTPWKVSEETEAATGQTAKTIPLFDYIDTIKDVCSEYGVACYDTANSGIYTWDADFRHLYFQSDNDISHLNPDGHDLFLPRAEKFLMTVLG